MKKRVWVILLLILIVAIVCSISIGYYRVSFIDIFKLAMNNLGLSDFEVDSNYETIVMSVRLPRIVAGIFVGAGLTVAGSVFQGMFKNPLVSPDVLGMTQGAGLGVACGLMMGLSQGYVQLFGFVGGLAVVAITYFIGSRVKFESNFNLILAGILMGSFCTAVITMIKYLADSSNTLPAITYWLMGSLAGVDYGEIVFSIIPIIIGIIVLIVLRWQINLLSLDEQEAISMGVNVKKIKIIVIISATIISSATVAIGGIIGWVGLVAPHVLRKIVGPQMEKLIPASIFGGAIFVLIVDDIARSIASMEIPLGVLTSLTGIPFILYIIMKRGDGL